MCKVAKYPIISLLIFMLTAWTIQANAAGSEETYNPKDFALHHIADANEWHIVGNFTIPLPIIVYHPEWGLDIFLSSKLPEAEHTAAAEVPATPESNNATSEETHTEESAHMHQSDYRGYVMSHSRVTTKDGSGFYDFSITKNVATLILTASLLLIIFISVAKAYKRNSGKAPSGLQSFMEPLIIFVRDEVVKPNLGENTDRFLPYMLTLFFFIWIANMLGLIPLISNPNLTGNITVTMALSLLTIIITNINGTRDYWKHILWPPGVPFGVKLILIPIEILGIFIKPFALMIRLFANITAGHIIILSLVGLVFIFGKAGESLGGGLLGAAIAIPFTIFMSFLELLVAFLQAFIFTMLSSLFIALALESHDHGHASETAHH
ncbi:MAG: F0F1 ATP synthase subunit A [Chitinophagales bacterium]